MPDIFLYPSQVNVYTIVLSDPTVPSSGSSVTVSVAGNAALLTSGVVLVEFGVEVYVVGNVITSSVRSVSLIATKPKIFYGRSNQKSMKRKRHNS